MVNLAAKYRPTHWEDVTEQTLVVDVLKQMCEDKELHNRNFLFTGPAGCGKTTLARLISNILNGGKGEVIEIDAASHSGVDAMREVISQATSYPVGCKWKIFIIDECHSISNAGWQSLLKTLEEQPAKSVFFFCTTNPEKIPATIISRVQRFQLSKISTQGIVNRLKYIIEQENKDGRNITYQEDAINYIAKLGNGGMRDSITLLDKCLTYNTNLSMDNLVKALDVPNYDRYFDLLNALAKRDNTQTVTIINDVYNSGTNFLKWFEGFHAFVCQIIKFIFMKDINATMIPSQYLDKLQNYGSAHANLCLRLANILVKMNQELRGTQYLQEVAITYLVSQSK